MMTRGVRRRARRGARPASTPSTRTTLSRPVVPAHDAHARGRHAGPLGDERAQRGVRLAVHRRGRDPDDDRAARARPRPRRAGRAAAAGRAISAGDGQRTSVLGRRVPGDPAGVVARRRSTRSCSGPGARAAAARSPSRRRTARTAPRGAAPASRGTGSIASRRTRAPDRFHDRPAPRPRGLAMDHSTRGPGPGAVLSSSETVRVRTCFAVGMAARQSAGILLHRRGNGGPRGPARPSGRPVLGAQGPRRVVDPQGRARRRRGPARVRAARVRRGDGHAAAGRRARRPRVREAQAAASGHGVRGRGRPRPGDGAQQHVRARVAAPVGPHAGLPGDRPRGVVRPRRGARAAQPRAGRVRRPAGAAAAFSEGPPDSALAFSGRASNASRTGLPRRCARRRRPSSHLVPQRHDELVEERTAGRLATARSWTASRVTGPCAEGEDDRVGAALPAQQAPSKRPR